MAPKTKTVYVCNECGHESARWSGQCGSCGAWNTMVEELRGGKATVSTARVLITEPKKLRDISEQDEPRLSTGMTELDRVLGGGIVPGGMMLIGGDPGIGKSTLLLQVCANLGNDRTIL